MITIVSKVWRPPGSLAAGPRHERASDLRRHVLDLPIQPQYLFGRPPLEPDACSAFRVADRRVRYSRTPDTLPPPPHGPVGHCGDLGGLYPADLLRHRLQYHVLRHTFFRLLRELEKGDIVRIVTTRGRFSYRVESLEVVEPEGISLTAPPSEAIATLITCFPFNYVGPAPRRFVARARLREGF